MANWISRKLRLKAGTTDTGARVRSNPLQADGGAQPSEFMPALKPSSSSTPAKSLLELPSSLLPRSSSLGGLRPSTLHVPRFLHRSRESQEDADAPAPQASSEPSHLTGADDPRVDVVPQLHAQDALPESSVSPTRPLSPATIEAERAAAVPEITTTDASHALHRPTLNDQTEAHDIEDAHVKLEPTPGSDDEADPARSGPEKDILHFGFGGAPEGLASSLVVPSDSELPSVVGLSGPPQLGELPAVLALTSDDWMSPTRSQAVKAS